MTTTWKVEQARLMCRACIMLAAATLLSSPPLAAGQVAERGHEVTFTKDIAPILQRSCQKCHRPDGGAPMSLVTYEEVRPWARSIKYRTGLRDKPDAMPPWYIEKNVGIQAYKGDISLSDAEIANVATWVDNGAPRGNPADMPPPLTFADASLWEIGEPDLIVSSPTVEVAASAPDWWGPIGEVPTALTEDRYIAAIEQKEINNAEPGATGDTVGSRWTMHHMIWNTVQPDQPTGEEMERLQKEDPEEFERLRAENSDVGFWPVHEVGRNADYFDPQAGPRLRAGSLINFSSVHLHSIGAHTRTRLDIGFKFHPRGYKPEYTNAVILTSTLNLDVRGNEANQRIEAFQTLPRNMKMTVMEPHLHAAGVRMCLDAIYTTGRIETLTCTGYNHSWVRAYTYADHAAPLLPKGTILRATGYFDTTAANKNVADPRNWTGLGHRSIEQMLSNITQGVYLTDEQFAEEMAQRRKALNLRQGQHVLGCPLCGMGERDELGVAGQDQ